MNRETLHQIVLESAISILSQPEPYDDAIRTHHDATVAYSEAIADQVILGVNTWCPVTAPELNHRVNDTRRDFDQLMRRQRHLFMCWLIGVAFVMLTVGFWIGNGRCG